jgi:hypothetical protein
MAMRGNDPERRGAPRRRVLKGSIILFNDRRSTIPCTVRDISTSGARLRVDRAVAIPDAFILIIELDGFEADCQVVARHGQEVGVRFAAPPRNVKPKRVQSVKATR